MEHRIIMTNLLKWQRKEMPILLCMTFRIWARTFITSSPMIASLALQVPNNVSLWTLPWSSSNQTGTKTNTNRTVLVRSHNQTFKYRTITIRIRQSTITQQMLSNIIISTKPISTWVLTVKPRNLQQTKMAKIKIKIKIKRCCSWFSSLPTTRISNSPIISSRISSLLLIRFNNQLLSKSKRYMEGHSLILLRITRRKRRRRPEITCKRR